MTVNHTSQEFFISFWRTEPPTIFDPEEMKKTNKIDTVLVAKVAVTPDFIKRINKALGDNIKTFEKKLIKGKVK